MRSALRATWLSVKASYWFIPALLTFASLLLALGTIRLDRIWGTDWLAAFGWFEGIGPEGARAQLTVISGAMIAISSTVFAITIAAVAYASGNYGPRLLTNFMNDRGNQVSLGVFVATFVYNLMVLRSVRNPADPAGTGESPALAAAFVPQLSMLVSTASVLIAVAVLVYFLHHIPASIRINTVLGGIGRRLIADIEKRFPTEGRSDEPDPPPQGRPVTARSAGYIEIIDFAELDALAERRDLRLALKVRTGDFVHPHLPMIDVEGEADEELASSLLNCFSLGNSRTPAQDLEFLIDELVEIGLRALSPGINDPFTAITCLHWLAAAMAKLAERSLRAGPEQETYRSGRVVPVADDFRHFLARGFGAMRQAAATNPVAAKVFVDALHGVARGATSTGRRAALAEEVRLFGEQVEKALHGPARDEIQQRINVLQSDSGSAFGR